MDAVLFSWNLFRDVCLPIVVLISLGVLLDRRFALSLSSLVKLNIHLFVPGFIFVKVVESSVGRGDLTALKAIGFTLSVIGVTGILGLAVARWMRWGAATSRSFLLSTMFYNCGNWGIPMVQLAYPGSGPPLHVFVLLTMNLSTFTLGLALASGHERGRSVWKSLGGILKLTPVYAISAGFLCKGLGIPVQDWKFVWEPLKYLDRGLVSIALITLGVQLSQTRPPRLNRVLGLSLAMRLLAGPVIAFGLTRIWGFDAASSAVLVLGASAPTAVNTALLAHDLKADSRFASAAVFYSTCMAVLTVTIILSIQKLFLTP